MKDHFSITSGVLPAATRVASFKGMEALSTPYHFEVNLLVPNEDEIELEDVVGDKVTLTFQPESGHVISGVIATFELLAEASTYGLFRATIVPKLWYLTLTHHSRVFVGESVKDIIDKILKGNDLSSSDYSFKLNGTYPPFDHVCQYQESDFNFISRLMEREGLYYFFEHSDKGEVLVITDDKSFHTAKSPTPVRYVQQMGADSSAGASLDTYVCRRTTLPTKVALKDYDPLKPKLDVSGSAPVSSAGQGEVHVYGGNFLTPADGARLAKLRAEEMLSRQTIYTGEGRVYDLSAGYTFTLSEHPRAAFNVEYLAVAVHHYGNQSSTASAFQKLLDLEHDEAYHVRVEAIPAKIQYRSARQTPIPRIYGTEEAVIDAEDGNVYAEIDQNGRYKVKIFFDETDLEDGKASMWVRMLQPHGGDIEGFHFPLRKGTEVHLVFLGGDPDRPVIAGVAHNAHNPSAVTQKNNTRNVVQTGGKNRIEMEDKDGAQYMHMKTEPKGTFFFMGATGATDLGKDDPPAAAPSDHNVHLSTDGTGRIFTDANMTIEVGTGDMEINVHTGTSLHHVTGTVIENFEDTVNQYYGKHHVLAVKSGGRADDITGDYVQNVHAGQFLQKVDSGYGLTVGGWGYAQTIGSQWVTGVEGPWHFKSASVDWIVEGLIKIEAPNITMDVAKGNVKIECVNFEAKASGPWKRTTAGDHIALTIGLSSETLIGGKNENTIGAKLEMLVGSKSEIKASVGLDVAAGVVIERAPQKLDLKDLVCDSGNIKLHKASVWLDKVETKVWSGVVNLIG